MKFEPRIIPENINTSDENPLKEFFILVGGVCLIILAVMTIALYASDYLIRYIPVEAEQRWFSTENFAGTTIMDDEIKDESVATVERYLHTLVDQLQDDTHSEFSFDVQILNDDAPNAFITPGGHIFVTRGLLETVTSENALAMVLGHEMGHQYHRHPLRGAGRGIILMLALIALSGADGDELTRSFIGNGASLTNLVFSREQEREADKTGVELLIRRYGHARGASEFFRQVQRSENPDSGDPVFLRTHPGTEERIDFIAGYENQIPGEMIPLPDFVTRYAD